MTELLNRLFDYNETSNRRFADAVRAVGSVPERAVTVFSHVLNAHRIWNSRIGGENPTGSWDVQPVAAWEELNRANHERTRQILAADSLDRVVQYRDLKGNTHRNTVRDILLQVITHSSYHRGQVAMLLGGAGATPPVTDYIAYAREVGTDG